MTRRSQEENILAQFESELSTTCYNAILKYANEELLFAVDHSQLRIMTSVTVDPIDWLFLSTFHKAVSHQSHLCSANTRHKSQYLRSGIERRTSNTRGMRTADVVTPLVDGIYSKQKHKTHSISLNPCSSGVIDLLIST